LSGVPGMACDLELLRACPTAFSACGPWRRAGMSTLIRAVSTAALREPGL